MLVVALLGSVYALDPVGDGNETRPRWAWGVPVVVAVFLIARALLLMA